MAVPVPVPVPDLVGVGRRLRWEVEVESDCPLDSVVEDSSWTEVPVAVVDLEGDQRIGQSPSGSGTGVRVVYCTVEDCR